MQTAKDSHKVIVVLIIIVLCAAVATYFMLQQKEKRTLYTSSAGVSLGVQGSDERYTNIDGTPISLEDYLGQTLIVHSWASWCPQCVNQLQLFAAIKNEKPQVTVIAINRAEDAYTAQRFLNHYELQSDVLLVLDPADYFYTNMGGYAMPETVVYGKDGTLVKHFRGIVTKEDIEEAINQNP